MDEYKAFRKAVEAYRAYVLALEAIEAEYGAELACLQEQVENASREEEGGQELSDEWIEARFAEMDGSK